MTAKIGTVTVDYLTEGAEICCQIKQNAMKIQIALMASALEEHAA